MVNPRQPPLATLPLPLCFIEFQNQLAVFGFSQLVVQLAPRHSLFFLPLCNTQISFRLPIVGHDGDHLQIAVRHSGRRCLLDKIGLNEGAFGGWLAKNPHYAQNPSMSEIASDSVNHSECHTVFGIVEAHELAEKAVIGPPLMGASHGLPTLEVVYLFSF